MPEDSGSFIAKELVEELRRSRPALTLTQIAGEYGESERNFRRYLKGNPMPLGKGRRFARRLKDLHLAAVTRLDALAQPHPRRQEASEFLTKARHAFDSAYDFLITALDELEDIIRQTRFAKELKRTQANAETLSKHSERMRLRNNRLGLDVEHLTGLIQMGLAHTQ